MIDGTDIHVMVILCSGESGESVVFRENHPELGGKWITFRIDVDQDVCDRNPGTICADVREFADWISLVKNEMVHVDLVWCSPPCTEFSTTNMKKIQEKSSLNGKSLKESNIGQYTGAIIIGILDSLGKTRMNTTAMASLASIRLQTGDKLIALGNSDQIDSLKKFSNSK